MKFTVNRILYWQEAKRPLATGGAANLCYPPPPSGASWSPATTATSATQIEEAGRAHLSYSPTLASASYFVDVIFQEDVPLPDLYVAGINPYSGTNVVITVCNQGAGGAGSSFTRLAHWIAPLPTGQGWWKVIVDLGTPAIAAGQCATVSYPSSSPVGYHNEYHVDADSQFAVSESNESNNRTILWWDR